MGKTTLNNRFIFYYIVHTALHKCEVFLAPLLMSSTAVNKVQKSRLYSSQVCHIISKLSLSLWLHLFSFLPNGLEQHWWQVSLSKAGQDDLHKKNSSKFLEICCSKQNRIRWKWLFQKLICNYYNLDWIICTVNQMYHETLHFYACFTYMQECQMQISSQNTENKVRRDLQQSIFPCSLASWPPGLQQL